MKEALVMNKFIIMKIFIINNIIQKLLLTFYQLIIKAIK